MHLSTLTTKPWCDKSLNGSRRCLRGSAGVVLAISISSRCTGRKSKRGYYSSFFKCLQLLLVSDDILLQEIFSRKWLCRSAAQRNNIRRSNAGSRHKDASRRMPSLPRVEATPRDSTIVEPSFSMLNSFRTIARSSRASRPARASTGGSSAQYNLQRGVSFRQQKNLVS